MRAFALTVAVLLAVPFLAADRHWQTGTWIEAGTKRKTIDFGPGVSPFGARPPAPGMRAMAEVRTYIIETDDVRLDAKMDIPRNSGRLEW